MIAARLPGRSDQLRSLGGVGLEPGQRGPRSGAWRTPRLVAHDGLGCVVRPSPLPSPASGRGSHSLIVPTAAASASASRRTYGPCAHACPRKRPDAGRLQQGLVARLVAAACCPARAGCRRESRDADQRILRIEVDQRQTPPAVRTAASIRRGGNTSSRPGERQARDLRDCAVRPRSAAAASRRSRALRKAFAAALPRHQIADPRQQAEATGAGEQQRLRRTRPAWKCVGRLRAGLEYRPAIVIGCAVTATARAVAATGGRIRPTIVTAEDATSTSTLRHSNAP